jgi:hypothetical protein
MPSNIALKVKLFNRAYTLAWTQISDAAKATRPDISEGLAFAIRKQITLGLTDPVEIAAEAIKDVMKGRGCGRSQPP